MSVKVLKHLKSFIFAPFVIFKSGSLSSISTELHKQRAKHSIYRPIGLPFIRAPLID